jgi:hypothetical protein
MKLTDATVDINIYDGQAYGTGEHYAGTVFVAYPIVRRGEHIETDTMGEPLMKVVLPGEPVEDDTWIQNTDQERNKYEDPRIDKILDFMFSILAD